MLLTSLFAAALWLASPAAPASAETSSLLKLEPCRVPDVERELRCGTYRAYENRQAKRGRQLPLRIVFIPARGKKLRPEPLFFFFGGPGETATDAPSFLERGWMGENFDIVLVDQRGTGEGHRLDCTLSGSDDNIQGYLDPIFQPALFRACRKALERQYDLTRYTTAEAMGDIDDIRRALGYDKILLAGASYGTRAVLSYMDRYRARVQGAMITSVMPPSLRNPLLHAKAAQQAFDGLVRECDAEPACRTAYPSLAADFAAVRRRLRVQPAAVTVRHPATGAPVNLLLSEAAFGEAVRVILYRAATARTLPFLIDRAKAGDFVPFAELGVQRNRALRSILRFGMMQSIVCSEDIPRIRPGDIERETKGTFLGDVRVREQMAACEEWPKAKVASNLGRPVRSNAPVLLVSGNLDPATPPSFAAEVARSLPNSYHLIIPGGHSPQDPCIATVATQFFRTLSAKGLDTSCVAAIRPPPFRLPEAAVSGA